VPEHPAGEPFSPNAPHFAICGQALISAARQSASMSFGDVDEQSIYLCTGNPEPKDVHQIVQWLLQEDYAAAYNSTCTLLVIRCGFG
jgi:hypothetical protein